MKISLLLIFLTLPFGIFAQTVESDNFILTDGYGHTTAQLTKSGEGTPALFFYDTKWTARISIWLYGDWVPGVVLNDENGLATALLRMVNNQGEPVLVLKEHGQDKFIIDKNGIRNSPSNTSWLLQTILISLISWWLWGFIVYSVISNKGKSQSNPYGGNIS